jgi:protein-tyrosine phosphatase
MANLDDSTKVLFVCLGNICRSPTAHGVFRDLVKHANWHDRIVVDSAGTGDWHIGHPPDARASRAALSRGFDLSDLVARQVSVQDFHQFDYILPMDKQNLADLRAMAPADFSGHLSPFLDFAENFVEREVPDPYYGGDKGFEHVLDLVEDASHGLLKHIQSRR